MMADSDTTTASTVLSPSAQEALESDIAAQIADWLVLSGAPGVSVAVVAPGGFELVETGGFSDLRDQTPVSPDDLWRVGSLTKPFTSGILHLLAEEGRVDLDAPVADYLGEGWAEGFVFDGVDLGDSLTVKQMLNFSSGFAEYATSPLFFAEALQRLDVPISPEEMVAWGVSQGPQFEPGADAEVSTLGYIVAGLVIEAVTGRPANELFEELIFEPAKASAWYLTPQEVSPRPVVNGYVTEGFADALRLIWPNDSDLGEYDEVRERAAVQAQSAEFFDLTVVPQDLLASAGWTGGGLEVAPIDVARAFRALFDGTILPDTVVESMTEIVTGGTYAQGVSPRDLDGSISYQQGGLVPGFASAAIYLPDFGVAVVAASNVEAPAKAIGELVTDVAGSVRDALLQEGFDGLP